MDNDFKPNTVTREQLEEFAAKAGVESPEEYDNKTALFDAIEDAGGMPADSDWKEITAPKRREDLTRDFQAGKRPKGLRVKIHRGVYTFYEKKG